MSFLRSKLGLAIAAVLVVALASAAHAAMGTKQIHVTAHFAQFKGIYVGDDVTILGVPVGKVTSVKPGPDDVTVRFQFSADHPVPADVKAAVVAPSLVSVRALILGPVGSDTSGPTLQDGAVIPESRTAVPVEWDDIKTELTNLSTALGPNGANKQGATSQLLDASAKFLQGNGANLNQTIQSVSKAMQTLADNSGSLFATVHNLQVFISAIKDSDAQVRQFEEKIASVTSILDQDRTALSGALNGMQTAFTEVQGFIKNNKDLTTDTIRTLSQTTSLMAKDRQYIANILQVAPTALSDFYNILDPRADDGPTGTLAFENLNNPATIICGALLAVGGDKAACAQVLTPLARYLALQAPPLNINGVQSNGAPTVDGTTGAPSGSSGGTSSGGLLGQLLGGLGGH